MTRVHKTIRIDEPPEKVFEYVTTPGNWPEWHPSSLGVSGATGHSPEPGEQVAEEFLVAGRRGRVVWTVRERNAPRRWVIDGEVDGGGGGTITYTLTPGPGGTTFERDLVYFMPNPLMALLDWLVLRRRVEAESAEALRRLKVALEATPLYLVTVSRSLREKNRFLPSPGIQLSTNQTAMNREVMRLTAGSAQHR